jgi:hypothetical protein
MYGIELTEKPHRNGLLPFYPSKLDNRTGGSVCPNGSAIVHQRWNQCVSCAEEHDRHWDVDSSEPITTDRIVFNKHTRDRNAHAKELKSAIKRHTSTPSKENGRSKQRLQASGDVCRSHPVTSRHLPFALRSLWSWG